MNNFLYDTGRKCLVGEGWAPTNQIDRIKSIIKSVNKEGMGTFLHEVNTDEIPPTYFKTNKFTASFHDLTAAYGVARYQEVNPGVFTIITFPFLFGVMFGDCGHGFLMLLFALWMVWKEDSLKTSMTGILNMMFHGRYLILLMALFSIYVGLIYNDCFSIALPIFESRWEQKHPAVDTQYSWKEDKETPYPFGVDYMWKGTKNELIYYNSLKMKMSVLLGVTHMMLGIILKFFNGWHYNKIYDIWFEFIPQFLFMASIFGYLCVLVVVKWCTNWVGFEHDSPGLLNMLIGMFLHPTRVDFPLYDGQATVQMVLLAIALISVPWMLFPKPLLLKRDHQAQMLNNPHSHFGGDVPSLDWNNDNHSQKKSSAGKKKSRHEDSEEEELSLDDEADHKEPNKPASHAPMEGSHDHEEFDFSEIFVHQVIHTIEFVLGAVSNTASYLRLWALSLAHAQLSTVFWVRILVGGLTATSGAGWGFVVIFCVWPIWAVITLGVLMGMESISAFLHALRLHWVEFMNKFYYGDGVLFQPFDLELIVHPPVSE